MATGGGTGGAVGSSAGNFASTAGGDRAAGSPESRLEASNKAYESSAHARSETVPSHVGDATPLTIINQMEATQKGSIGESGQKILDGFAVHSDGQVAAGSTGESKENLSPHPGYSSADRVTDNSVRLPGDVSTSLSPHPGYLSADRATDNGVAVNSGERNERDDKISIPDKGDLQNRPITELRATLDQNNQRLEAVVGQHLPKLQEHFLGFHGTNGAGMDRLSNTTEDGKSTSIYVATSTERSNSPQEWIANTSQALDFATAYSVSDQVGKSVQGGGVAVIDMGAGSRNGKNFGVDSHNPADTQFWGMASKAGEAVEEVDSQANPEQVKGFLNPSRWADVRAMANSPITDADSNERSRLAGGFVRQAMINDLLKLLNVSDNS
ncbi:MAG: hypothetical protein P4L53_17855 [Candidatus Obscuribacterales bacterium]|nr:hypothetical protein [Candidatus Obscuribacterales bacterium]